MIYLFGSERVKLVAVLAGSEDQDQTAHSVQADL